MEEKRALMSEFAALRNVRLVALLFLAFLVNAATFCGFTYLAPVVTETAELPGSFVPLVLAIFGAGALLGVLLAGRVPIRRPVGVGLLAAVLLALGWLTLGGSAGIPALFFSVILLLGALSFGLGGTLITRFMGAAVLAPTMAGAFATMSFNVGATLGPALGGFALSSALGATGPALLSAGFIGLALLSSLVSTRWLRTS